MDDLNPDVEPHDDLPTIPEILHSAFHEGPFTNCDACGADLRVESSVYPIQKNWRNGEVVFELALCAACLLESMTTLSRESLERLRAFQEDRYQGGDDLDACHFCRKALGPLDDYEIGAVATRSFLLRPPAVMCGECGSEMQEQLSKQTRDGWGEFLERVVPGVPGEMVPDGIPLAF
jgi:predicted nucleic acid-binding Zn ribbon protein